MATLAQALELKKKNPNLSTRDAIAQVEGNVGTQQVPTNNVGINNALSAGGEIGKQQYQKGMPQGMNSVAYTQQGVNGETFQVAPTNAQGISTPTQPVQPPTPAPAPVTPPPTATPTPTQPTTATVAPEDKAAEIQAKNQAQMDLNKQKSQLAIEDRKRQAEEAKQASIPTDEKGVLNTLISGGSVAPQNTQAYRNAQFKYKNYQKFNAMTPQQLLDNMKMGEIDTETSQLLASNPNYVKAKEDFDRFQKNQSINNMVRSTYGGATGKKEEVDYYNKSASEVAKRLGVNETNAEAFARIVSGSTLVTQLTQTVSNTAKQLNELNNERNNVYADLKKQYPDLSPSAIMTLMGQRTQGLTDQINALNSTLSLTQADLKNAMEMAQAEYGAVSADIQAQQEIAKEQRAIDNSLALSQMQFDQKIKQQAEMMNDPTQAINSVIAQYADQGIMASTSAQQHIAEFMKQNREKGTTLGQYISQMQKDFQAKPEYKAKFSPKTDTTPFQIANLGDGKALMYNQSNGQYQIIGANGQPTSDTSGYYSGFRVSQDYGAADTPNSKDVVLLANGKKGTPGIDYVMPENTPVMSTVTGKVTFVGPKGDYGNQVEVTDAQGNKHMFSHMNGANVKIGDNITAGQQLGLSGNTGFSTGAHLDYRVKGASGKWEDPKMFISQGNQVSDEAKSWVDAWNKGTMDLETILTKIGSSKEAMPLKNEVIKAISQQGGVSWRNENDPAVGKMNDIIDKLDSAAKSNYINTIAGTVQTSLTNFLTGGKNDLLADLKTVIEGGTLQSLIDAKAQGATFGALSNEELKMLQATSSSIAANAIRDPETKEIIGFRMSEKKLKEELQKMKKLFEEKKARMTGVGLGIPVDESQNTNTGAGQTNQVTGKQTYTWQ